MSRTPRAGGVPHLPDAALGAPHRPAALRRAAGAARHAAAAPGAGWRARGLAAAAGGRLPGLAAAAHDAPLGECGQALHVLARVASVRVPCAAAAVRRSEAYEPGRLAPRACLQLSGWVHVRGLLLPASLVLLAAAVAASSGHPAAPGSIGSSIGGKAAHLDGSAAGLVSRALAASGSSLVNVPPGLASLLAECTSFAVSTGGYRQMLPWPSIGPAVTPAAANRLCCACCARPRNPSLNG